MRIKQKIELIDRISRELQANYTFEDIYIFLKHFGIDPSSSFTYDSKHLYSKDAISDCSDEVILHIAEELEISSPSIPSFGIEPPRTWKEENLFRLFISHLAIHKDKANKLKNALSKYYISSFVAHEDIHPTLEWQREIERALWTMDAMLTVNTEGFSSSVWTQQEIGFALGRGVKVITLKMDEDPKGFISKEQSILRRGRDAFGVSEEISTILMNDPSTKGRMADVKASHQSLDDEEIPF